MRTIELSNLQLMLPEYSERKESYFSQRLTGKNVIRVWTRNQHEPVELTLDIGSVSLLPEAESSIPYLMSNGLIRQNSLTAVIDIGGLTSISFVVDASGYLLPETRRVEGKGSKLLFSSILNDPRFIRGCEPLGGVTNATSLQGMIIRANEIASVKKQPIQLIYSNEPSGSFDFTSIYIEHTKEWLMSIINAAKSDWGVIPGIAESLRTVIFIGGGARIVDNFIEAKNRSWQLVPPNPQFASVLGALNDVKNLKVGVVDGGNRTIKSGFSDHRGEIALLDSQFGSLAEVPRRPTVEIPKDTLIIQYVSGPCLRSDGTGWIYAFGSGVKALKRNAIETHASGGKEHIGDFLGLAGLANAAIQQQLVSKAA